MLKELTKRYRKPDIEYYIHTPENILYKRMLKEQKTRSDFILGIDIFPNMDRKLAIKKYLHLQYNKYERLYGEKNNVYKVSGTDINKFNIEKSILSFYGKNNSNF